MDQQTRKECIVCWLIVCSWIFLIYLFGYLTRNLVWWMSSSIVFPITLGYIFSIGIILEKMDKKKEKVIYDRYSDR